MSLSPDKVEKLRSQFPAFERKLNGQPVAYFDGPAGTQVPRRVAQAISDYLFHHNANHEGLFQTSIESDEILDRAHRTLATFVGGDDPGEIVFGQNMTSLTFAFSRALSSRWEPGDEIIVTRLDHDANITPWVLAARDRRVNVHYVDFDPEQDYQLDLKQLESYLSSRTRLVAVGCASNASGGINPVKKICQMAHGHNALTYLDAVHLAPHRLIDVVDFECDFLACSAYKFFGPHTGILWGKRKYLDDLSAYKLRPASDELPGKWMTGTQSHECIAGSMEAVEYLADIGRNGDEAISLRKALKSAFDDISKYEGELAGQLLEGFNAVPGLTVHGISEPGRNSDRVATFSISHRDIPTSVFANELCQRGHFVWNGNYYALQFSEFLGKEPEGMVRIGALHYNTAEEVDRLLKDIHVLASAKIA